MITAMFDTKQFDNYRNISIAKILNQQEGRRVMCPCPFGHKDKTPSFVLFPDNHYHCFSCGKHGYGAIDFCRDIGYTFNESLEELKIYL